MLARHANTALVFPVRAPPPHTNETKPPAWQRLATAYESKETKRSTGTAATEVRRRAVVHHVDPFGRRRRWRRRVRQCPRRRGTWGCLGAPPTRSRLCVLHGRHRPPPRTMAAALAGSKRPWPVTRHTGSIPPPADPQDRRRRGGGCPEPYAPAAACAPRSRRGESLRWCRRPREHRHGRMRRPRPAGRRDARVRREPGPVGRERCWGGGRREGGAPCEKGAGGR